MKEDQGDPQDQGQGERPRNQGDDREEEDGEGEIDIGEDGGGGNEVPDRLEALDAVGERTRGRGPFLRPHPQDLFHHFAGEADVGPDGCQVDEVSPRHVQGEVGRDDHEDAKGHHPEGFDRPVRDDPVVDVHDEQRHGQGKKVA